MGLVVQDLDTYDGKQTVYPTVNESVNIWREGLSQIPTVKRAASICSGGEISFFCVAPRVREHLTLLDHSYQSMYFALGKFHLIDKLGSKEAYKALLNNDIKLLREIFEEANAGLPTAPPKPGDSDKAFREYEEANAKWTEDYLKWQKAYYVENPKRGDSYRYDREYAAWESEFYTAYNKWCVENPKPQRPPGYGYSRRRVPGFDYWWHGCKPAIEEATQAGITEFRRHRHKIEFVHGDLTDLETLGPFDLVYLSNALGYAGRKGKTGYDTTKWVKPGGYVCLTYSSYAYDLPPKAIPKEAEKVFEYGRSREAYDSVTGRYVTIPPTPPQKAIPTTYGSQWAYAIFKLPE